MSRMSRSTGASSGCIGYVRNERALTGRRNHEDVRVALDRRSDRVRGARPRAPWREAFDGFLKTPDFTSDLTKVSVPVLLMWGDRGSYALRAAQDRLLEVMPNARFIAYHGFGHAFHWEDPEQFTRDLVPFLRSFRGDFMDNFADRAIHGN